MSGGGARRGPAVQGQGRPASPLTLGTCPGPAALEAGGLLGRPRERSLFGDKPRNLPGTGSSRPGRRALSVGHRVCGPGPAGNAVRILVRILARCSGGHALDGWTASRQLPAGPQQAGPEDETLPNAILCLGRSWAARSRIAGPLPLTEGLRRSLAWHLPAPRATRPVVSFPAGTQSLPCVASAVSAPSGTAGNRFPTETSEPDPGRGWGDKCPESQVCSQRMRPAEACGGRDPSSALCPVSAWCGQRPPSVPGPAPGT